MRPRSCALPKPDTRGRWRPVVGTTIEGKPQRFQVGNDKNTTKGEAERRLGYIRDLYGRQCAELGVDCWAGWALGWAQRIAAQGVPIRIYPSTYALVNEGQAAEELAIARQLQAWGVPIEIADPALIASGDKFLQGQITQQVNRAMAQVLNDLGNRWGPDTIRQAKQQAIPDDPLAAETRTLHVALDAYSEHLQKTGKRNQEGELASSVRKSRDRLRYLKDHHEDVPIWKLNLPAIEEMAAYWRNRPKTAKAERCSFYHARDMNKDLFRFLDWLDSRPDYSWEKPRRADKIRRSPPRESKNEGVFQTIHKETYTPEQLAQIVQYADALGRAVIAVSVNCGFGASEIGKWPTKKYVLFTAHPHAVKVGITSTDADSWIVGNRPKTGVYGEHWLWPEVARAVVPFLDGRPFLPMTGNNTPWYRTYSNNPQSKFAKWWRTLLDRATKHHEDLPRLPFGSLRDLLPDILRREYSDEIASMCLQHGSIGDDDLLKCYANVPFRKLLMPPKN